MINFIKNSFIILYLILENNKIFKLFKFIYKFSKKYTFLYYASMILILFALIYIYFWYYSLDNINVPEIIEDILEYQDHNVQNNTIKNYTFNPWNNFMKLFQIKEYSSYQIHNIYPNKYYYHFSDLNQIFNIYTIKLQKIPDVNNFTEKIKFTEFCARSALRSLYFIHGTVEDIIKDL